MIRPVLQLSPRGSPLWATRLGFEKQPQPGQGQHPFRDPAHGHLHHRVHRLVYRYWRWEVGVGSLDWRAL